MVCYLGGYPRPDLSCSNFSIPPINPTPTPTPTPTPALPQCSALLCADVIQNCLDGTAPGLKPVCTIVGDTTGTTPTGGTGTQCTGTACPPPVDTGTTPTGGGGTGTTPTGGGDTGTVTGVPDVPLINLADVYRSNDALLDKLSDDSLFGEVPTFIGKFVRLLPQSSSCSGLPPDASQIMISSMAQFCPIWDDQGGRDMLGYFFAMVTLISIFFVWAAPNE